MTEQIEKLKKDLEKSSGTSLTKSLSDRIKLMAKTKDTCILADVSGSMDTAVDHNGIESRTKWDVLVETLCKFNEIKQFAFSSGCREILQGIVPRPNSSTNMAGAFEFIKDKKYKEAILITDGMPDSPQMALAASFGLKLKIIYIGPPPRPQFLEDLAKVSKGTFTDLSLLGETLGLMLETKIKGFLE